MAVGVGGLEVVRPMAADQQVSWDERSSARQRPTAARSGPSPLPTQLLVSDADIAASRGNNRVGSAPRPSRSPNALNSARPPGGSCVQSLVVKACLQDHEVVAIDEVYEAVFFAYASRPCFGEHLAKWLWFANARGGVPQCVVDQSVDAFESGATSPKPIGVVAPSVRSEDQPHRVRSCSSRCPVLACCRLSIRRLAFAGTRSRCAVSSSAS